MKHSIRYHLLGFCIIPFLLESATWQNWGKTVQCAPSAIFYPESLEDVQEIIKKAVQNQKKVKAIGAGHSWSDLVCTDGFLINTDNLDRLITIDLELNQIKVEAGIRIKNLIKLLAENNLCMRTQGFITEQSIAGAIATATHGTGKVFNLSDYIISMEIIDGTGALRTISPDNDSEWLNFLRVGLGALGFIYTVTIQCEPLFKLKHRRFKVDLTNAIEQYSHFYDEFDFFMFMFQPQSSSALLFTWNRTNDPVTVKPWHYALNDCVFHRFLNACAIRSLEHLPQLSPYFIDLGLHSLLMEEHVDYAHISLSPMKAPVSTSWYIEEEIAVPFESFIPALYRLINLYKKYADAGFKLASTITCRFGPGTSHSSLSPCYQRKTAYITINILNHFDAYEDFFHEFEQGMECFNGRPHWGKFHYLDKNKIIELYGLDTVNTFNSIRHLLDPHNIFVNDFIKRCFE